MVLVEVDSHRGRREIEVMLRVEHSFETRDDREGRWGELVEVGKLDAEL